MKAHYTTFEGEEQFKVLREKASQLGNIPDQWTPNDMFGYDVGVRSYMAYRVMENTSIWYQEATYLPYNEYLDYLDRCIAERDV